MSYSDDCAVLESRIYQLVDFLLGNNVDVGRGFVQNDDFVLSEDGPANADKLLFTH